MEDLSKMDSKNEKIIDKKEETIRKNLSDINHTLREKNKYINISCEKLKEKYKDYFNIIQHLITIIFSQSYYMLNNSLKWILDEFSIFEKYYKNNAFFNNVFFCILSIFDTVAISIYKYELSTSFLNIRIISDILGITIFWIIVVLYNNEQLNKKKVELLGHGLMSLFDIFSFVIFLASNSNFNVIVLMCFLIHLILCIAIFSFNLCKFMC